MRSAPAEPTFPTLAAPPPTFRDPDLQERFARHGFVVLPFLTPAEVDALRSYYWSDIARPEDDGLVIDFDREDRSVIARIATDVRPLLDDRLASAFVDHRTVFATFVAKHPGPWTEMSMHEDRSWVDERRHRSGSLWIPLIDIGPGLPNGGVELVPRSHLLGRTWSGTRTPQLHRPFHDWLAERLEGVSVRAGDALYFDSRTLHASVPNTSSDTRIALVATIVPKHADLIHVVGTGTTRRSIHAVDESFYLRYGPWVAYEAMPSEYPVVEEVDERVAPDPELVAALLGEEPRRASPVVPLDVAVAADTGWRRIEPVGGPTAERSAGRAAGHPATDLDLEPGSRLRLTAGTGPVRIDVVDAAPVAAGVVCGDGAANFLPGERYLVDEGATVWNDGPGTLRLRVG